MKEKEPSKLGIIIFSVEELSERLRGEEVEEIRREVQKRRFDFTVERV